MVLLEEAKLFLRIDHDEEDALITDLIETAKSLCRDITRDEIGVDKTGVIKTAILYAVTYLYEHREEADHKALITTMKNLLFSNRREVF